jgi:tRNA-specific 2-thiouridylase
VLELDHEHNTLVVGTEAELGCDRLLATNVNWTLDTPVPDGMAAQCKIRYRARPVDCTLHPLPNGDVEVRFAETLRDITPGQGAIFYVGDLCLGGGIIAR